MSSPLIWLFWSKKLYSNIYTSKVIVTTIVKWDGFSCGDIQYNRIIVFFN